MLTHFVPSVVTSSSGSAATAKQRALSLYKAFIRAAPSIVNYYRLDISASQIRAKIRSEFEKNRYVNDLQTIDILLFKARTEYEETMNMWKQKTHVMRYFDELDKRDTKRLNGFLDKFYAGQ